MMLVRGFKKIKGVVLQDDFWHGDRKLGAFIDKENLSGYYNDLSEKTKILNGKKWEGIVPLVIINKKYVLHPVTVCQVGLGYYEMYLKFGKDVDLLNAKKCADWLVDNYTIHSDLAVSWKVPYEFRLFQIKKDFVSSLIQGQAISLLTRVSKHFNSSKYLDIAIKSYNLILLDKEIGGCKIKCKYAFEEYPTQRESLVLNGLISTLWGIYDLAIVKKKDDILNTYNQGVKHLKKTLHLYDTGFWSRYCILPNSLFYVNWASPYYHREHIAQLQAMYLLTNDKVFQEYAIKWQKYYDRKSIRAVVISLKGLTVLIQKILRKR